ncbi:MAG: hypothetical protein HY351_02485, partial [Candidatus Omnitrophica bacterium]|nr:hypothetical protein [Candidatus Omnitrophota bacterium]
LTGGQGAYGGAEAAKFASYIETELHGRQLVQYTDGGSIYQVGNKVYKLTGELKGEFIGELREIDLLSEGKTVEALIQPDGTFTVNDWVFGRKQEGVNTIYRIEKDALGRDVGKAIGFVSSKEVLVDDRKGIFFGKDLPAGLKAVYQYEDNTDSSYQLINETTNDLVANINVAVRDDKGNKVYLDGKPVTYNQYFDFQGVETLKVYSDGRYESAVFMGMSRDGLFVYASFDQDSELVRQDAYLPGLTESGKLQLFEREEYFSSGFLGLTFSSEAVAYRYAVNAEGQSYLQSISREAANSRGSRWLGAGDTSHVEQINFDESGKIVSQWSGKSADDAISNAFWSALITDTFLGKAITAAVWYYSGLEGAGVNLQEFRADAGEILASDSVIGKISRGLVTAGLIGLASGAAGIALGITGSIGKFAASLGTYFTTLFTTSATISGVAVATIAVGFGLEILGDFTGIGWLKGVGSWITAIGSVLGGAVLFTPLGLPILFLAAFGLGSGAISPYEVLGVTLFGVLSGTKGIINTTLKGLVKESIPQVALRAQRNAFVFVGGIAKSFSLGGILGVAKTFGVGLLKFYVTPFLKAGAALADNIGVGTKLLLVGGFITQGATRLIFTTSIGSFLTGNFELGTKLLMAGFGAGIAAHAMLGFAGRFLSGAEQAAKYFGRAELKAYGKYSSAKILRGSAASVLNQLRFGVALNAFTKPFSLLALQLGFNPQDIDNVFLRSIFSTLIQLGVGNPFEQAFYNAFSTDTFGIPSAFIFLFIPVISKAFNEIPVIGLILRRLNRLSDAPGSSIGNIAKGVTDKGARRFIESIGRFGFGWIDEGILEPIIGTSLDQLGIKQSSFFNQLLQESGSALGEGGGFRFSSDVLQLIESGESSLTLGDVVRSVNINMGSGASSFKAEVLKVAEDNGASPAALRNLKNVLDSDMNAKDAVSSLNNALARANVGAKALLDNIGIHDFVLLTHLQADQNIDILAANLGISRQDVLANVGSLVDKAKNLALDPQNVNTKLKGMMVDVLQALGETGVDVSNVTPQMFLARVRNAAQHGALNDSVIFLINQAFADLGLGSNYFQQIFGRANAGASIELGTDPATRAAAENAQMANAVLALASSFEFQIAFNSEVSEVYTRLINGYKNGDVSSAGLNIIATQLMLKGLQQMAIRRNAYTQALQFAKANGVDELVVLQRMSELLADPAALSFEEFANAGSRLNFMRDFVANCSGCGFDLNHFEAFSQFVDHFNANPNLGFHEALEALRAAGMSTDFINTVLRMVDSRLSNSQIRQLERWDALLRSKSIPVSIKDLIKARDTQGGVNALKILEMVKAQTNPTDEGMLKALDDLKTQLKNLPQGVKAGSQLDDLLSKIKVGVDGSGNDMNALQALQNLATYQEGTPEYERLSLILSVISGGQTSGLQFMEALDQLKNQGIDAIQQKLDLRFILNLTAKEHVDAAGEVRSLMELINAARSGGIVSHDDIAQILANKNLDYGTISLAFAYGTGNGVQTLETLRFLSQQAGVLGLSLAVKNRIDILANRIGKVGGVGNLSFGALQELAQAGGVPEAQANENLKFFVNLLSPFSDSQAVLRAYEAVRSILNETETGASLANQLSVKNVLDAVNGSNTAQDLMQRVFDILKANGATIPIGISLNILDALDAANLGNQTKSSLSDLLNQLKDIAGVNPTADLHALMNLITMSYGGFDAGVFDVLDQVTQHKNLSAVFTLDQLSALRNAKNVTEFLSSLRTQIEAVQNLGTASAEVLDALSQIETFVGVLESLESVKTGTGSISLTELQNITGGINVQMQVLAVLALMNGVTAGAQAYQISGIQGAISLEFLKQIQHFMKVAENLGADFNSLMLADVAKFMANPQEFVDAILNNPAKAVGADATRSIEILKKLKELSTATADSQFTNVNAHLNGLEMTELTRTEFDVFYATLKAALAIDNLRKTSQPLTTENIEAIIKAISETQGITLSQDQIREIVASIIHAGLSSIDVGKLSNLEREFQAFQGQFQTVSGRMDAVTLATLYSTLETLRTIANKKAGTGSALTMNDILAITAASGLSNIAAAFLATQLGVLQSTKFYNLNTNREIASRLISELDNLVKNGGTVADFQKKLAAALNLPANATIVVNLASQIAALAGTQAGLDFIQNELVAQLTHLISEAGSLELTFTSLTGYMRAVLQIAGVQSLSDSVRTRLLRYSPATLAGLSEEQVLKLAQNLKFLEDVRPETPNDVEATTRAVQEILALGANTLANIGVLTGGIPQVGEIQKLLDRVKTVMQVRELVAQDGLINVLEVEALGISDVAALSQLTNVDLRTVLNQLAAIDLTSLVNTDVRSIFRNLATTKILSAVHVDTLTNEQAQLITEQLRLITGNLNLNLSTDAVKAISNLMGSISPAMAVQLNLNDVMSQLQDPQVVASLNGLGANLASIKEVILMSLANGSFAKLNALLANSTFSVDELKQVTTMSTQAILNFLANVDKIALIDAANRQAFFQVLNSIGNIRSIIVLGKSGLIQVQTDLGTFFAPAAEGVEAQDVEQVHDMGGGITLATQVKAGTGTVTHTIELGQDTIEVNPLTIDLQGNTTVQVTVKRNGVAVSTNTIKGSLISMQTQSNTDGTTSLIIKTSEGVVRLTGATGIPTRVDQYSGINPDLSKPANFTQFHFQGVPGYGDGNINVNVEGNKLQIFPVVPGTPQADTVPFFEVELSVAPDLSTIHTGPNGEIIFRDVLGRQHTIQRLGNGYFVDHVQVPTGADITTVYNSTGEVISRFQGEVDINRVNPNEFIITGENGQVIHIEVQERVTPDLGTHEVIVINMSSTVTAEQTSIEIDPFRPAQITTTIKTGNEAFAQFTGPITIDTSLPDGILISGTEIGTNLPVSVLVTGVDFKTAIKLSATFGTVQQSNDPTIPVGTVHLRTPEGGIVLINAQTGAVIRTFGNVGNIEAGHTVLYLNGGMLNGQTGGVIIYNAQGFVTGVIGAVGSFRVGDPIRASTIGNGTRVIFGQGMMDLLETGYSGTPIVPLGTRYLVERANAIGGTDQTIVLETGEIVIRRTNASGVVISQTTLEGGSGYTVLPDGSIQYTRVTPIGVSTISYLQNGARVINGNNILIDPNTAQVVATDHGVEVRNIETGEVILLITPDGQMTAYGQVPIAAGTSLRITPEGTIRFQFANTEIIPVRTPQGLQTSVQVTVGGKTFTNFMQGMKLNAFGEVEMTVSRNINGAEIPVVITYHHDGSVTAKTSSQTFGNISLQFSEPVSLETLVSYINERGEIEITFRDGNVQTITPDGKMTLNGVEMPATDVPTPIQFSINFQTGTVTYTTVLNGRPTNTQVMMHSSGSVNYIINGQLSAVSIIKNQEGVFEVNSSGTNQNPLFSGEKITLHRDGSLQITRADGRGIAEIDVNGVAHITMPEQIAQKINDDGGKTEVILGQRTVTARPDGSAPESVSSHANVQMGEDNDGRPTVALKNAAGEVVVFVDGAGNIITGNAPNAAMLALSPAFSFPNTGTGTRTVYPEGRVEIRNENGELIFEYNTLTGKMTMGGVSIFVNRLSNETVTIEAVGENQIQIGNTALTKNTDGSVTFNGVQFEAGSNITLNPNENTVSVSSTGNVTTFIQFEAGTGLPMIKMFQEGREDAPLFFANPTVLSGAQVKVGTEGVSITRNGNTITVKSEVRTNGSVQL